MRWAACTALQNLNVYTYTFTAVIHFKSGDLQKLSTRDFNSSFIRLHVQHVCMIQSCIQLFGTMAHIATDTWGAAYQIIFLSPPRNQTNTILTAIILNYAPKRCSLPPDSLVPQNCDCLRTALFNDTPF